MVIIKNVKINNIVFRKKVFMAENSFKNRIQADVPKTKHSNNTNSCRNLTPEEFEEIIEYSCDYKKKGLGPYNWEKMWNIIRSKILKGVINMHMAKGENIGSISLDLDVIEQEAKYWLYINEQFFNIKKYNNCGEITRNDVEELLHLLIIPGCEEERRISIQGNTQK